MGSDRDEIGAHTCLNRLRVSLDTTARGVCKTVVGKLPSRYPNASRRPSAAGWSSQLSVAVHYRTRACIHLSSASPSVSIARERSKLVHRHGVYRDAEFIRCRSRLESSGSVLERRSISHQCTEIELGVDQKRRRLREAGRRCFPRPLETKLTK